MHNSIPSTVRCDALFNSNFASPLEDAGCDFRMRLTTAQICSRALRRCSSSAALLIPALLGSRPPAVSAGHPHMDQPGQSASPLRPAFTRCRAFGQESAHVRKHACDIHPSAPLPPLLVSRPSALLLLALSRASCLCVPLLRFLRCFVRVLGVRFFFSWFLRSPPPVGLTSSLSRLRSVTSWRVVEQPIASSIWPALCRAQSSSGVVSLPVRPLSH